jgi:hypothetical protein
MLDPHTESDSDRLKKTLERTWVLRSKLPCEYHSYKCICSNTSSLNVSHNVYSNSSLKSSFYLLISKIPIEIYQYLILIRDYNMVVEGNLQPPFNVFLTFSKQRSSFYWNLFLGIPSHLRILIDFQARRSNVVQMKASKDLTKIPKLNLIQTKTPSQARLRPQSYLSWVQCGPGLKPNRT